MDNKDKGQGGSQQYCMMCGKPESEVGKLMRVPGMPGSLGICSSCMNRSMEAFNKFDYSKLADLDLNKLLESPLFRYPGSPFAVKEDPDTADEAEAPSDEKAGEEDENAGAADREAPLPDPEDEEETAAAVVETTDADSEEEGEEKTEKEEGGRKPTISFLNLSDLLGGLGGGMQQPKVKKKKKNGPKPVFSIDNIPAPHKIKEELDKYVIGQERAKKIISVAAYNHYKRVRTGTMDDIEIEKSNILMIGPTGCGKTYLVRTLARLLDVPLAITDATSLTEAGYIGDDIESVVSKLLAAADNDVEKTEKGIIFIDEVDKIAKKRNFNSRDVSGESVQQGMLKLLEGADVEVPVGANSKNAMVPLTTINTRNILFICGGAFPELEKIVRERMTRQTSLGFSAELRDKYEKEKNILDRVTNDDLRKFGMIPEFIGRLPILCTMQGLDRDMLVRILKEPKNAILKQYQKLLALDEVNLEFEDEALEAIAEKALEKDTGARALRSIIEEFMLDIMYEIPKDDNIGTVIITRAYVEGKGGPVVRIREDRPVMALPDKS